MAETTREAELLATRGLVLLLLADYLSRQPNPDAAARWMLNALPDVLKESLGDGLRPSLVKEAGQVVKQFIEDADAIQALWRGEGRKPV